MPTPVQILSTLLDGQWHEVTCAEAGSNSVRSLRMSFRYACEKHHVVPDTHVIPGRDALLVRCVPVSEQIAGVVARRKSQRRKTEPREIKDEVVPWSHEFMMMHSPTYRQVDEWLRRTKGLIRHG